MDKTSDPVRLYLREMGTVPLLTRQGEIEIAKRFERGHLRVLKAISRCPIVIREVKTIGSDLESGARSIKEMVVFNEEDVTDDICRGARPGDHQRDQQDGGALQQGSKSWKKSWPESAASRTPSPIGAATGIWDGKELPYPTLSAHLSTPRRSANA